VTIENVVLLLIALVCAVIASWRISLVIGFSAIRSIFSVEKERGMRLNETLKLTEIWRGKVVKLKSGVQRMTISSVTTNRQAFCVWHDVNGLAQGSNFSLDCLEEVV